jgi:hypothetical protein
MTMLLAARDFPCSPDDVLVLLVTPWLLVARRRPGSAPRLLAAGAILPPVVHGNPSIRVHACGGETRASGVRSHRRPRRRQAVLRHALAVLPPIQRVFLYELPGGEVDGGGVAPQARFWDSFLKKKKSEPNELGEI